MPNSTYRQIVDRVLALTGQAPIGTSSGDFNSNTLDKTQQQAKEVIWFANNQLSLTERGRYTLRKFTITTDADGPNVYGISTKTSFEKLVRDSFFVVAPAESAGPLCWKSYRTWLTQYPAGPGDQTGTPAYWMDLPPALTGRDEYGVPYSGNITAVTVGATTVITVDANQRQPGDYVTFVDAGGTVGDVLNGKVFRIRAVDGLTFTIDANTTGKAYTSGGQFKPIDVDRVAFDCLPASGLTIQYEGYLNGVTLENETDEILWPQKFEHLLIAYGCEMLESLLGEGKDVNWLQKLEPYMSQVKQNSLGPSDEPPGLVLGIEIGRYHRRGINKWNTNSL